MSATTTDAVTDKMRDALMDAIMPFGTAVGVVKEARGDLCRAQHITDAFLATGLLILAVEAMEDLAKDISTQLRTILRDTMEDAGCFSLGGEVHSLTLADAPRTTQITDAKALAAAHPELMTTPEPQPDRKAIADLLRRGRAVTGAELSNGGQPVLKITTKKVKS